MSHRPNDFMTPAERLYGALAACGRDGLVTGGEPMPGWCGSGLVDAVSVALPGSQAPSGIDVWLGAGVAAADVPRRWKIDGQWVAIRAHGHGRMHGQMAQVEAVNISSDPDSIGSIACLVRDRFHPDQVYVLSCGHVFGGQPGARSGDRIDIRLGGKSIGVGVLKDWMPVLGIELPRVGIDAGIARIDGNVVGAFPSTLLPAGVATTFSFDDQVVLRNAMGTRGVLKTRWSGYVDIIGTSRVGDYYLQDAIGYVASPASGGGDSGAAVWSDAGNQLIGIHVGAPVGDPKWGCNAILCPIDKIMQWFDVEPIFKSGATRAAAPPLAVGSPSAVAAPVGRQQDVDTVAMTLWGEARGEGEEGMRAVACVIGTRARLKWRKKEGFVEVCRDRWQFSCWNENDPNLYRLEQARRTPDAAFRKATEIAQLLVNGNLPDFTKSATHYFASSLKQFPKWAIGKEPCLKLGKHLFFNDIN